MMKGHDIHCRLPGVTSTPPGTHLDFPCFALLAAVVVYQSSVDFVRVVVVQLLGAHDDDDDDEDDGDSGDDNEYEYDDNNDSNDDDGDNDGDSGNDDNGDDNGDNDSYGNNNKDNDEDNVGDGGRRVTAAADGVVWGRRQAAKAAEMGINRKCEQCGYDGQIFLCRKFVTWVTFYMYPTAFPGY